MRTPIHVKKVINLGVDALCESLILRHQILHWGIIEKQPRKFHAIPYNTAVTVALVNRQKAAKNSEPSYPCY